MAALLCVCAMVVHTHTQCILHIMYVRAFEPQEYIFFNIYLSLVVCDCDMLWYARIYVCLSAVVRRIRVPEVF